MSFNGNSRALLGWKWVDDTLTDAQSNSKTQTISEGSGSGEGDASWSSIDAQLLDTATVEYDFTALPFDSLGVTGTRSFRTIIAILISSSSDSTGGLQIGGASTNQWQGPFIDTSDKISLEPGSQYLHTEYNEGWPVSSSVKNLKLEAGGGDVTYTIAVVGVLTI